VYDDVSIPKVLLPEPTLYVYYTHTHTHTHIGPVT